jgi:hypothetical protein
MHLCSIYETGELTAEATLKNFLTVRQEGTRQVRRNLEYYSREVAKAFAESEFEKYRVVQDRLFESDFDRHIRKLLE